MLKSGLIGKICIQCREKARQNLEKNKCPHGRQKCRCKDCKGSSYCSHGRQKRNCRECGGSALCEHLKQKGQCLECGTVKFCEHGKRPHICVECGGSSLCEHGRLRSSCKSCLGLVAAFKTMISGSRKKDLKLGLYDEENFIDLEFLSRIYEENPELECHFCHLKMSVDYNPRTKITIDRLDNELGHVVGNCVFSCFSCNSSRG